MAVNEKHPLYGMYSEDWESNRDAYDGQRKVKEKGVKYLPPTEAMLLDGMSSKCNGTELGYKNYQAYLLRAVFPDFMRESVETHIGLLHSKAAVFEVPEGLKGMLDKATGNGESIHQLLRSINEQQLVTGRLGLLLDVRANTEGQPLPYISLYWTEHILNWDEDEFDHGENKLKMVVLDESGPRRVGMFTWEDQERYRILMLGAEMQEADAETAEGESLEDPDATPDSVYSVAISDGQDPTSWTSPMIRSQKLNEIPFVFINSKDLNARPDRPPLQGLSDLCYTIYRSEADYRESLHKQGQDTLVVIGGMVGAIDPAQEGQPLRVGANSRIEPNIGGDAKYIGVSSQGLPEQRMGLENDRQQGRTRSGQVLPTGKSSQESGEALKTRIAAQTATLNQIALTSAAGLTAILKIAARWMGLNEEEVKVTPNLEFSDFAIPGQEFLQLVTAKTMGAPLSWKSLHQLAQERGLTNMDFDTEMAEIESEPPPASGTGALDTPPKETLDNPDDEGNAE